jgi:hypothetical protein
MITNTMPLTELTTATIKLLCREIGVVNTARFLNQFTTGYGNYTEERAQLLGDRSVDEIVAEIKRRRQASDVVQGKLDPA